MLFDEEVILQTMAVAFAVIMVVGLLLLPFAL